MTTIRPKTFTFRTSVVWKEGVTGVASSQGKPEIRVSTPPELRGPQGNWSPEELYIASVESCLMLTFLSLARSRQLQFAAYESRAEGVLEPVYGKQVVSRITVRPRVTVKSQGEREKAQGILANLHEHCFISNSIESEVTLEPEVVVGA